jgi:hypothetical protein
MVDNLCDQNNGYYKQYTCFILLNYVQVLLTDYISFCIQEIV